MTKDKESEKYYELLDSGGGEKLERFGPRVIARPSSICIWQKTLPRSEWERADAHFFPGSGWRHRKDAFENWQMQSCGCIMELRLQSNGQVGVFPEHAMYLSEVAQSLGRWDGNEAQTRCLNLFAYTGLASVFLAKQAVTVTHVDLAKRAIEWARRNMELNQIGESNTRFILEDSLSFLTKEAKRGKKYDVVIADPPSFSRVSKTKHWKLSESLPEFVKACYAVLDPEHHIFVLTCHEPELSAEMLSNVVLDHGKPSDRIILKSEMSIPEKTGKRRMPAGSLVISIR